MPRLLGPLFAALFCFLFLAPSFSFAQLINNTGEVNNTVATEDVLPDPSSWQGILDSISQAIERPGVLNSEFDGFLEETNAVSISAQSEVNRLEVQVEQLKAQLDELGPKPEDNGVAEAAEITEKRVALESEFAALDAKLKEAKVSLLRTQQIEERITTLRKDRFFSKIELQTENLFTFGFWGRFLAGFEGFGKSLGLLVTDSFSVLFNELSKNTSSQILLALFSLVFILIFMRARDMLNQFEVFESETQFGTLKSRFIRFCRSGVLVAILPYLFYKLFSSLGLLTKRMDELLQGIVIVVGFVILAITLMHILTAKSEGRDRLLKVSDATSSRIRRIINSGLLIALFLAILNTTSTAIIAPFEVAVGLSLMSSLVIAATCMLVLWALYKDNYLLGAEQKEIRFWRVLKFVSWILSFVIIATGLFGYVALGEFLAQQLLFGLVVIGSVWLLLRFVDRNFQPLIEAEIAAAESDAGEARKKNTKQALILGNGLINLGIYSAAGILLMLPWGYRTSDFYQIFNDAFFGFEIGGLRISIATILFAVVLFVIGYTITIALRSWLNNRYLPTTGLDIGVSNSISTVLGYLGFAIAAVLAISAAGFDLSNLAIVAGALSLGIGFGLQSIVSNFVSGLILLAERPIKAGDWVVTTGGEGTVTKISVRSTEIETFERATIIVPNSSLITDPVTNWTHDNKLGRIAIAIGVGYDSDPEQVREILLKCANENPRVLSIPQASVFFMDFGASSLDFQLRCFLSDINYMLTVQSELRFAILKALREANIEIPFPQRVVTLTSDENT